MGVLRELRFRRAAHRRGGSRAASSAFETDSKDSIRGSELAFHEEAHGQRCGVPAACCEPAKYRLAGGVFVEVVGLRIELRGERKDLLLVDPQAAGAIDLAYGVIFKILIGHFSVSHFCEHL